MSTIAPLRLSEHSLWPPVVLAPMAGITNVAFRRLCREYGAGLYVCEMITSRALVERDAETMRMVRFDADESPRSMQLYGVDPAVVAQAVRMVVTEEMADHIDLNFGCPVPKVTRKGGGSALPYKRRLFRAIVRAAVAAADDRVPVTVKIRKGIDDERLTYLDAGRIAQDEGAAWVALHGRTAAQLYGGTADWLAIARLKDSLEIPVLGNGDIWEAEDAVRMVHETGCDGVVVGRGCLGRPWLFGELAAAFDGRPPPALPDAGRVTRILRRHAELLVEAYGPDKGIRDMRKHMAWYLKGFSVGSETRHALGLVDSLEQLDQLLGRIEPTEPYPEQIIGLPRGRTTPTRKVALPDGWLDDPEELIVPAGAELAHSGG
ncbi:MAG: tRNA dihydrouridine synthase DusB [Candidatus Nanopelagicales bacterium]